MPISHTLQAPATLRRHACASKQTRVALDLEVSRQSTITFTMSNYERKAPWVIIFLKFLIGKMLNSRRNWLHNPSSHNGTVTTPCTVCTKGYALVCACVSVRPKWLSILKSHKYHNTLLTINPLSCLQIIKSNTIWSHMIYKSRCVHYKIAWLNVTYNISYTCRIELLSIPYNATKSYATTQWRNYNLYAIHLCSWNSAE